MGDERTARLLRRLEGGDSEAAGELLTLVYSELKGIAARLMDGERHEHTLQATALVHEAWLRLHGADSRYESRRHFLRVAAQAMRRVLVDHARARRAGKRGGDRRALPLDEAVAAYERQDVDLLALDEALVRLGERDPQLLQIVELRSFAGLTLEEAAEVLGATVSHVHRGWTFAQRWLRRELDRGGAGE